jgi:hypothetical protein
MTDVWSTPGVTFDQPAYMKGALMTMTVASVTDVETIVQALPLGTLAVQFTAADGSTNIYNFTEPQVSQIIVASSPVTGPATVTDSTGRIWTLVSSVPAGTFTYTATA